MLVSTVLISSNRNEGHVIRLFVCMFGGYRPTRKFFTHIETSSLPVKGYTFWPMLGTHDHWAVRVLYSVPHALWHGASVYNGNLRGLVTLKPIGERLAVKLSLPVLRDKSVGGEIWTPQTSRSKGQRSNPLRRGPVYYVFENVKFSFSLCVQNEDIKNMHLKIHSLFHSRTGPQYLKDIY